MSDETEPIDGATSETEEAHDQAGSWRADESEKMKQIRAKRRKGILNRFVAFRGTLGFRREK